MMPISEQSTVHNFARTPIASGVPGTQGPTLQPAPARESLVVLTRDKALVETLKALGSEHNVVIVDAESDLAGELVGKHMGVAIIDASSLASPVERLTEKLKSQFPDLVLIVAGHLNDQRDAIVAATDSINGLAKQFADNRPVLDKALHTIPDALAVVSRQRQNLVEAIDRLGKFSALAADSTRQTKDALVAEFNDLAPVLDSLANAGPALTRSLSMLSTFPWPKEYVKNVFRGDAANLSLVFDLTLSRLDSALFTGTRFEGDLTQLETQWGRTIGQLPSPATNGNPLIPTYHLDQGP